MSFRVHLTQQAIEPELSFGRCGTVERGDPARAPFRRSMSSNRRLKMADLSGSCFCKAVRFVVHAAPERVGLCHCMDCRSRHGAPFKAFVVFRADDIEIQGELEPVPSRTGRRYACAQRHVLVYWRTTTAARSKSHWETSTRPASLRRSTKAGWGAANPGWRRWTCRSIQATVQPMIEGEDVRAAGAATTAMCISSRNRDDV